MIKKNQRYFNWIDRLSDMLIVFFSYLFAVLFWFFILENDRSNIAVKLAVESQLPVLCVSFIYVVVFQYVGVYDSMRFITLFAELVQMFKFFLICTLFCVGIIFMLKLTGFSRGVMLSYGLIAYSGLSIKRVFLRVVLRKVRKEGYNQKYMLLVGDGELAMQYVDVIRRNPGYGCQCIGYVGQEKNDGLGARLGGYYELGKLLEEYEPDEVIIALEPDALYNISMAISACEGQGIRASIIPHYSDYLPTSATIDVMGNMRLINLRANMQDIVFNQAVKRSFDIVFALTAIIITAPLLLITAMGVRLSSPGPVLFRQERVGKERISFTMYKFRSMKLNSQSETAWSVDRDSRVTRFGAFIRKFSIDELPQFFNVLRGDMSVVGPRPELPHFVEKYKHEIPRYMVKHQVKPGITGWAQVNGFRGDTSIEKRIQYDLWYIENWSVFLDIKIIIMTIFGGMINQEKNLFKEEKEVSSTSK